MRLTKKTTCTECGATLQHVAIVDGQYPVVKCAGCGHLQTVELEPNTEPATSN